MRVFLFLTILTIACNNNKADILDEQKLVKQKIKLIDIVLDGNQVIKKTTDSIIGAKADLGYPVNFDSVVVEFQRLKDQSDSLMRVKEKLVARLDTLELILKK